MIASMLIRISNCSPTTDALAISAILGLILITVGISAVVLIVVRHRSQSMRVNWLLTAPNIVGLVVGTLILALWAHHVSVFVITGFYLFIGGIVCLLMLGFFRRPFRIPGPNEVAVADAGLAADLAAGNITQVEFNAQRALLVTAEIDRVSAPIRRQRFHWNLWFTLGTFFGLTIGLGLLFGTVDGVVW